MRYELNNKYAWKVLLVGLIYCIGMAYWVMYGNTLDGFGRFLITLAIISISQMITMIPPIRKKMYDEIKETLKDYN